MEKIPQTASVELYIIQDGIIEIEEDKFVSQVQEIYNYPDKYLGQTINYQGYFYLEEYESKVYYAVVRNTIGCECSGDEVSVIGFEIEWSGDMPEEGTWVEVTGILDSYMEEENQYGLVRVSNLVIKDEVGKTFITE